MASQSGACTIYTRSWSANKSVSAPVSRSFGAPRNWSCRSYRLNRGRNDNALTGTVGVPLAISNALQRVWLPLQSNQFPMKILVIGSGGREHALAWKLRQSSHSERIFCAPGNAGTAEIGENVPIPASDLEALVRFAKENRVDLTVVGPDDPLAAGIVDLFAAEKLRAFGPAKSAARIESSKIFAKELMRAQKIPTAEAKTFSDSGEALRYCERVKFPVVIKADGLALGKGVTIAADAAMAQSTIDEMMNQRRFGDPETQALLPRMKSDLLPLLEATIDGTIDQCAIEWDTRAAVTVVLTSAGYPGKYETGKPISGLDDAAKLEDVRIFHAGTKRDAGEIKTAGGRVLAVTALGSTIETARARAYEAVSRIHFENCHYRRDIALSAVAANIDELP